MALTLKYYGVYDTQDEGQEITVQFLKEGWGGGNSEIRLGADPVHREDGAQGSDELAPTRPTLITCDLHPFTAPVYDEIYEDVTAWQMRVLIDGAEDFRGPIVKDLRQKSLDDFGQGSTQVRAICGIGALDTPFYDTVVADGHDRSRQSVVWWLQYILSKTGLNLPLNTSSNWYAFGMTSGDPLAQEFLSGKSWTHSKDRTTTFFDVLTSILRPRGMFVHQRSGQWWAFQRRQFTGVDFTYHKYAAGVGGALQSSPTYTSGWTLTTPKDHRRRGGMLDVLENIGTVVARYDHGTIESLIPNGNLEQGSATSDSFDGWTKRGTVEVDYIKSGVPVSVAGNLGDPGVTDRPGGRDDGLGGGTRGGRDVFRGGRNAVTFRAAKMDVIELSDGQDESDIPALIEAGPALIQDNPVQIENTGIEGILLSFTGVVELSQAARDDSSKTFLFLVYAKVKYTTGGTTYTLQRNKLKATGGMSWQTGTDSYVEMLVPGNEEFEVSIQSPSLPAGDGTISVELLTAVDTSKVTYSAGAPSLGMFWNDVRALPVIDAEGTVLASTQFEVSEVGGSGPVAKPVSFTNGTGPTIMHLGAALASDGSLLNDWGLGVQGSQSGHTMAERWALDRMAMRRSTLGVIKATYRKTIRPMPILSIDEGGGKYLPTWCRYSYFTEETEVEAPELRLDGFTPNVNAVASDAVAAFGAKAGEGTAIVVDRFQDFVRNFSTWNALTYTIQKLTGVITNIGVDTIAAEQAVLAAGEFLAVAGINGGVYEFEIENTPTAPITNIDVVSKDIGDAIIPIGSGVYPSSGSLVTVQTATKNALYSSVASGAFSDLTADADGLSVTSLSVTTTPFALKDGWKLSVGPSTHPDYLGVTFTVTVDGDVAESATSIPIFSQEIHLLSGDDVSLSGVQMATEVIQQADEIILRAKRDELVSDINNVSQTEVVINPDMVSISGLTQFASGYNPFQKADIQRSVSQPGTRKDGSPLQNGDIWIAQGAGSGAGDRPYVWHSLSWVKSTTEIDGAEITTGTVNADRISIGAGTVYADGYNPATKAWVIRSESQPTQRPDTSALQVGDVWIAELDGDRPYTWNGSAWSKAYTAITGGDIVTGTITATNIAAGTITANKLNITTLSAITANMGVLNIDNTLTMAASGEITNSSADYVINDAGLDFTLGDGTWSATRAVTWNRANSSQRAFVAAYESGGFDPVTLILGVSSTSANQVPDIALQAIGATTSSTLTVRSNGITIFGNNGALHLPNLPTSDPSVLNQVYRDASGFLKITI